MLQFLPYLVLAYAVCSIALLWAYQKTRLFPLYILKVAWTSFTILAFIWVVGMSFGQSKEYIQNPAGPYAIIVGEMKPGATELTGGYPQSLYHLTHTRPQWVIAALFCAWLTWGITRKDANDSPFQPMANFDNETNSRAVLEYASPVAVSGSPFSVFIVPLVVSALGLFLLAAGKLWFDAILFAVIMAVWLAIAMVTRDFFSRYGAWLLGGLAALLAIPVIPPLFQFQWSRYSYAFENYKSAWVDGHIGDYFINSLMVTITTVSITTLLAAMAAYVLARREFTGRKSVYGIIIGSIAVPGILIQVPLFLLIKDWSFTVHNDYRFTFMDSRLGLSIIYTAISLPFTIFVMTGFFRSLPASLGEASVIDGCGQWKTFTDIYLPLALPGIATTGIFNFLGAWNEFNLGMIFISNPAFKTLPIGLYELQTAIQYSSAWAPMFAGIVLLCLPTFLIFVFLQQRIVAGLTAGGLKA